LGVVWGLCLLGGLYPLFLAWRANETTTLRSALVWAGCAWAAWLGLACAEAGFALVADAEVAYVALCLTGCAGVAVLDARRPGVGAWNFVVGGLLAVLLRPLLEGLGRLRLDTPHLIFLGAALAVPLANYLPTRLGPAALACAAGCALETATVGGWALPDAPRWAGRWLLAASPWLGLVALRAGPAPASELDALWRNFRDRFGFLWGQRLREQFNRAAENAGWPVRLGWRGLRPLPGARPPEPGAALATLRAALQRFGPPRASPPQQTGQ
jgi:hypothetical protein